MVIKSFVSTTLAGRCIPSALFFPFSQRAPLLLAAVSPPFPPLYQSH